MTAAHEIRNLIKQTTTGTRRRRVPKEVNQQVRRYAGAALGAGEGYRVHGWPLDGIFLIWLLIKTPRRCIWLTPRGSQRSGVAACLT